MAARLVSRAWAARGGKRWAPEGPRNHGSRPRVWRPSVKPCDSRTHPGRHHTFTNTGGCYSAEEPRTCGTGCTDAVRSGKTIDARGARRPEDAPSGQCGDQGGVQRPRRRICRPCDASQGMVRWLRSAYSAKTRAMSSSFSLWSSVWPWSSATTLHRRPTQRTGSCRRATIGRLRSVENHGCRAGRLTQARAAPLTTVPTAHPTEAQPRRTARLARPHYPRTCRAVPSVPPPDGTPRGSGRRDSRATDSQRLPARRSAA